MSLSSKQWKSTKAKTLMGETVTKALVQVEAAAAKCHVKDKEPIQLADLSAFGGSVKLLQGEITKTRAKCTKGIHDETAGRLDQMGKEARQLYADVQKTQQEFHSFLQGFVQARDASIKALQAVEASQLPKTVVAAKKTLDKARDYVQNSARTFSSSEIEAGVQQFTSAGLILDRIAKVQAERPPAAAGARALPATPADLKHELAEVRAQIVKLATPGGFHNVKLKTDLSRPFGSG